MSQIVYVATNECMPGLVKIGRTTAESVEDRIRSLAGTGVPLPFECHFAAEVDDCARVERVLHALFAADRVNPAREFFRVDPERVVLAISIGAFEDVTPRAMQARTEEEAIDDEALERDRARRSRLDFSALGIEPGETLVLSRDESITCEVINDAGRVLYAGEEMSLSRAALAALQSLGYKATSISGPGYWTYDGETLDERRRRLEDDTFGGSHVRAEAVRESWKNPEVAAARAVRNAVMCEHAGQRTRYASMPAAFRAHGIPFTHLRRVRLKVNRTGSDTYEHDGREFAFSLAA